MKHNWQYKKLGEICHSKKDVLRALSVFGKEDIIEYIDISSINRFNNIITSTTNFILSHAPSRAQQCVKDGDVIISLVRPNLKNIAIIQDDRKNLVASSGFCVLRGKDVLNKYIYYIVSSEKFTNILVSKCAGAAYPAVKEEDIKDIIVPLPPLAEQERIVAELDRINGVMEDCRQLLRTLDALAQSLFYDSFGDPITNPKAWPTQPLKQVAPASSSKAEPEESNGKFWLLNLDQVESNSGRIIEKQFFSIQEIGASTVLFDENNVLYSKLRPYLNKVVIPNGRGYCTSELIPLKPNNLLKEYLAYSLRLPEFVQYISGKTGGAKMPRVKMNYFWDFQLPVPPLELQQQFARRIEAIEAQKKAVEKTISTLQTLLDSRMDYWFN